MVLSETVPFQVAPSWYCLGAASYLVFKVIPLPVFTSAVATKSFSVLGLASVASDSSAERLSAAKGRGSWVCSRFQHELRYSSAERWH